LQTILTPLAVLQTGFGQPKLFVDDGHIVFKSVNVKNTKSAFGLVSRTVHCFHPAVLSLLTVALLNILPTNSSASSPGGFDGLPVSTSVLTLEFGHFEDNFQA
jgi:hypothetical protein